MNHLGLFEGIGGFSFAAKQLGWKTIAWCESNSFCQKVLRKNFPEAEGLGDIRTIDFNKYKNAVDIITGGFPCQDISISGKGHGITANRSGLWFEMQRAIEEIRPRFVVIENSPELLKKGFEKVIYPLSEMGYSIEWGCLFASQYGAQHSRERLFVVAYSGGAEQKGSGKKTILQQSLLPEQLRRVSPGWRTRWDIPTPKNFRSVNDVPHGLDRIGALGNSLVPIIALEIFKAIEQYETTIL